MNTISRQGCDNEVTPRQRPHPLARLRTGRVVRPMLAGRQESRPSSRMQTAGVGMADVRLSPRQAPSPVGFTRAVPSQCSGGQQDGAAWRCSLCP